MAGVKIPDQPEDANVTGVELVPISDVGNSKHTKISDIKVYTIDEIEAVAAGVAVSVADSVFILQGGDLKPVALALPTQYTIDQMWGKAAEATPDSLDILLLNDGGTTEKTVTAAKLAEYVRATIEAAILDVSDLDAAGALVDANMVLVTQGTTGKKSTLLTLSAYIFGKLLAYTAALPAVTLAAASDYFYIIQGGVEKKITRTVFTAGLGTTIAPATTTENKIPQWDSTQKTLKDGLTLQAAVRADGSALDTAAVTEKAVRDLEKSLINNSTGIGADLVGTDTMLVDDGAAGTQRKSAISRIWTYVLQTIQGLAAKTTAVGADILTIQDSEDSNALKELTITNLKAYLDLVSLTFDDYRFMWTAGQRGKPGINADIQDAAEATRMVTNPDFEILGTNAVSSDVSFYAEGGITLLTAGADGDEMILLPHLDANQSGWTQITWGTDQATRWECRIRSGASIADCIIWAGLKLTNTEVSATDADQAFFRYEDGVNAGEFQCVSSVGGGLVETDSDVVVAIDTEYHLVIDIQNDRSAKFYVNSVLVATSAPLTDATDLIPYIGVAADGAAAAKTLIVRAESIRRNFA